jgi:ribosomal protein L15E
MQIVVAFEVMNFHAVGDDLANRFNEVTKLIGEIRVRADPQIKDVADQEKMGRTRPLKRAQKAE